MKILHKIWYYTFWMLVKIDLKLFFSKIKLSGMDKIPKNAAIIFGSNHENAFLDALILTTSTPNFDHYLVRADVFKNKIAKLFLNSWNLMPVYRMADGIDSVRDNAKIFEACHKALGDKNSVVIFPEAQHELRRIKRRVKKGIARIALGAVNYPGGTKELYIVPVGLNYSEHTGFRSSIHLVFGDPILVETQEESQENIEILRATVDAEMAKCYMSFDRANQVAIDAVLMHDSDAQGILDPIALNEKSAQLVEKIKENPKPFDEVVADKIELETGGLTFPYRPTNALDIIKLIGLAPLALIGLLLNAPALLPIYLFVKLKIKDNAFVASMKVGFGLVLFPVWWWQIKNFVFSNTGQWIHVIIMMLITIITLVSLNAFVRTWKRVSKTQLVSKNGLAALYQSFVKKAEALRNS